MINKYGMRYSSIKYWQAQSRMLRQMRGLLPHISMLTRYANNLGTMPAREIAHIAIQIAAVGKADLFRFKG